MSRLAAVHLSKQRFGNFSYLKDGFESCLEQSRPQECVNQQSFNNKNYAQRSGNMTFWRLGDIDFQVFLELHPLELIGNLHRSHNILRSKRL